MVSWLDVICPLHSLWTGLQCLLCDSLPGAVSGSIGMMQAEDDRRCWAALSEAAAAEAAAAAQPPVASLPPEVSAALRLGQPGARLARLPQLARRLAAVLERAGAGPPAFDPASLPGAACAANSRLLLCMPLIRWWCHSMSIVSPACTRPCSSCMKMLEDAGAWPSACDPCLAYCCAWTACERSCHAPLHHCAIVSPCHALSAAAGAQQNLCQRILGV